MYRICKRIELESGHLLSKHPGNCQFPHGHTRSVEIIYAADTLDTNDMVMDFKAVREMMETFLEQFDHALCMNTDDPHFADFSASFPLNIATPPAKSWPKPSIIMLKRRWHGLWKAAASHLRCAAVCDLSVCACGKRVLLGLSTVNNELGRTTGCTEKSMGGMWARTLAPHTQAGWDLPVLRE